MSAQTVGKSHHTLFFVRFKSPKQPHKTLYMRMCLQKIRTTGEFKVSGTWEISGDSIAVLSKVIKVNIRFSRIDCHSLSFCHCDFNGRVALRSL